MILKELAATILAPFLALTVAVAPASDCITSAKTTMDTALTGLRQTMQAEKARLVSTRTQTEKETKTATEQALAKAKEVRTAALKATESLKGKEKAAAIKAAEATYTTATRKIKLEARTATQAAMSKYSDAIRNINKNQSVESNKIQETYKAAVAKCKAERPATSTTPTREKTPPSGPITVPVPERVEGPVNF